MVNSRLSAVQEDAPSRVGVRNRAESMNVKTMPRAEIATVASPRDLMGKVQSPDRSYCTRCDPLEPDTACAERVPRSARRAL